MHNRTYMKRDRLILCGILILLCFVLSAGRPAYAEDAPDGLLLTAGGDYCFSVSEKLFRVPTVGRHGVMQGGGRDDRYAYYAMVADDWETMIFKYDLNTWECVAVSEPLLLGHANDISYDPVNHRLGIARVYANRIDYVDPDTLEITGNDRTIISIHRLAYLPDGSGLVIGTDYMYIRYNSGNCVKAAGHFTCRGNRYTTQGMTTDGRYLYDVRWNSDLYESSLTDPSVQCDYIVIHDLEGNLIGDFPVYGLEGEPENIICLGGNRFAIGCNGSDSVYLAELKEN